MANTNRYWYVKRGRLGLVEDATGGQSVNGVSRKYQSIAKADLSVRYDAVLKERHFSAKQGLEETLSIPEQFHDAIVYKAISLGYEVNANFSPEKADYFNNKYQERVKKAKAFARRYYNGNNMRINPIDF